MSSAPRLWRGQKQRYRLAGIRYSNGYVSLQNRKLTIEQADQLLKEQDLNYQNIELHEQNGNLKDDSIMTDLNPAATRGERVRV